MVLKFVLLSILLSICKWCLLPVMYQLHVPLTSCSWLVTWTSGVGKNFLAPFDCFDMLLIVWFSSGKLEWGCWAHLWLLSGGHLGAQPWRRQTYVGFLPQDHGDFWDVNCFRGPRSVLPLLSPTFTFYFSFLSLFLFFPSSLWDVYRYTLTPQFLTRAWSSLTFAICVD